MAELKPTHVKPSLYAFYYELLKEKARELGYNLVLHGSMQRDLDLIAIPWVDDPKDGFLLIQECDKIINGKYCKREGEYGFSILPGGRKSYVISINRGGAWNDYEDGQYYLDISITPLKKNEDENG